MSETSPRTLVGHALDAVRRGFAVFPCKPRSKVAAGEVVRNGCHGATRDPAQICRWWDKNPDYNPAVHCDTITVLDIDEGVSDLQAASDLVSRLKIPRTLIIHSGRREAYGLHIYFDGVSTNGPIHFEDIKGDLRSYGYYTCWNGAIHPDSGEPYEIIVDAPPAPLPDSIRLLKADAISREWAVSAGGLVTHPNRQRYLFECVDFHWAHGVRNRQALENLAFVAWTNGCEQKPYKDVRRKIPEIVDWFFKLPNLIPNPHIRSDRWIVYQFEREPRASDAWNARLDRFFDGSAEKAYQYLLDYAREQLQVTYFEQIVRVMEASSLKVALEQQLPEHINNLQKV
jgi:hypothetical protein